MLFVCSENLITGTGSKMAISVITPQQSLAFLLSLSVCMIFDTDVIMRIMFFGVVIFFDF